MDFVSKLTTVTAILMVHSVSYARAQDTCSTGWTEYDNNCWYFSRQINGADKRDTWIAAESWCQSNGGELAIFETEDQRSWVTQKIVVFDGSNWWIGLTDHALEGTYRWNDGSELTTEVANWKFGEPSNTGGEDCVEVWIDLPLYRGQWNDKSCDANNNFICKKSKGEIISCPDGWKFHSNRCYKVYSAEQQWAEARAVCRAEGGELTAITSSDEQTFVSSLVLGKNHWIGLSDTATPGTLTWSNAADANAKYSQLASGQSFTDTLYTGSTCCEMDITLQYKWNQMKCSNEHPFVCEKGPKGFCPTGWMLLADKCYEFIVNPNRGETWTSANEKCQLNGAGLLKIESDKQQQYLAGVLEQYYNSGAQEIWIGGSDIGHDDIYKWWDNTNIDPKYWDINMPRYHPGRDDCMAMYTGKTSYNWETSSCFHERQYICELPEGSQLPTSAVVTIDGKCETDWRLFKENCYFFGGAENSQSGAETYCTSMSSNGNPSHLASILDADELSFIEGHLQSDSWIGLKSTGTATFVWTDGTPYTGTDFNNWQSGTPATSGQCVYARENAAVWIGDSCSSYHTFVCKKGKIPIPQTEVTPETPDGDFGKCGGDGWFSDPLSEKCYKVNVEQTRTWNDARFQCQKDGGDLAAINSPKENEFIAAATGELPYIANLWIGGSDKLSFQDDIVDVIDGGWSWSDGTPFNYVNWNTDEPNNSGQEDCLEMYVASGFWNDLNCAGFRHFICEKMGNNSNIIGVDVSDNQCKSNEACCFKHLGIEFGGAMPDSSISASSIRNNNYNETRGRLNTPESIVITSLGDYHYGAHGGWEPESNDMATSWLQVDFVLHTEIKGIITQGRTGYNQKDERQWVKTFKISYSQDPDHTREKVVGWEFLSDENGVQILFQGNRDQDTQVTNLFPRAIIARHVRCHPVDYFDRVGMRLEYIGCKASCLYKIGMNSGFIPDEKITASSGDAKQSRAPVDPAECLSSISDQGASYRGWISKTVNGIDCQPWASQSPHSHDRTPQNYPDSGLVGNFCRNPDGEPSPWCYTMSENVRWAVCAVPVCPSFIPTGWTSTSQSRSQFVQVEFDGYYKVSGITLYSSNTQYYVSKYYVQFSDNGQTFVTYKNQAGSDHAFTGVHSSNMNYLDVLREPISTKFLRISPQSWNGNIILQFEINGCYVDRRITCSDKGNEFEDDALTVNCPGGCIEDTTSGIVYGTDTYTESSAICLAAVHSGKLTNRHGGSVDITKINGRNNYAGSTRNGVTSLDYSTATQSMIFNGNAFRCADGWYPWNEHCYYFSPSNNVKTWTEARAACKSMQADLASILTTAENDFIHSLVVQSFQGNKIWIGLNALDEVNFFRWSDGSIVTITQWDLNEPNSKGEKCVQIYRFSGFWNDASCENTIPYLCKKEKQHLPPITTIYPPTDQGCDVGWTAFGVSCYRAFDERQPYPYANQLCRENVALPVQVDDMNEQSFLHAFVTASVPVGLGYTTWIGMTAKNDPTGAQIYQWESGDEIVYTHWSDGEPDVTLKCSFPFVYKGETYYECTTASNPIALLDQPWCSLTPVFAGALMYCGNGNPQGCTYIDDQTGFWKVDMCTALRFFTCEKPRVGYTQPIKTTPSTEGYCASGWYSTENLVYCYQINEKTNRTERATWQGALDHCRAQRADLVSIHSSEEEAELETLITTYGTFTYVSFWTGLNSIGSSGYSWSDGTGVGYTNWATGEPSDHNGKEECVESMLLGSSQWNDLNCDAIRNWMCKIRKNIPPLEPPTLPPPAGTESTECGTEDNWIRYTASDGVDKCYLFVDDVLNSWQYAENSCVEKGGHLVAIHSQDENTMVLSRAAGTSSGTMWIGLRDIGGRAFYWADDTIVDYVNWAPGEPNNYLNTEDCGEISADTGLWNDDNCGIRKPYICEKCVDCSGQEVLPTETPTGNCPEGFSANRNKCYYSSGSSRLAFDQALEWCRNNSAELAVINNAYEQAFLTSYFYGDSANFWIGMSDRGTGSYAWMDQAVITYTNWYIGQPDKSNLNQGCVETVLSNEVGGKWKVSDCSVQKSFFCYAAKSNDYVAPPSTSSPNQCDSGYYSWDRGCYLLVDEPKTYDEASSYCRDQGNYLVNLATVFENELLHSWFWDKISQSENIWTGLSFSIQANSETSSNTTFAWSNGWPVAYTNWDQNQPNSEHLTVGSGCVFMDSNGYWSTATQTGAVSCSTPMSFVCEFSLDPIPTDIPPFQEGNCDVGFVGFADYCYYINVGRTEESSRSWYEAGYECEKRGGKLASFHSDAEIQFLIAALDGAPSHNLFIGLFSDGFSGWKWEDNTGVDYLNWNDYEPNGQSGEECVEMYPWSGTWNDVSCYEDRGYVCRKPKEYTRCVVPIPYRIECGYPDITESSCVSRRGCCWDPTVINANFSGCYYAEDHIGGPSGIPQPVDDSSGLSGGAIAGIIIGVLILLALVGATFYFIRSGKTMPSPSMPSFSVPTFGTKSKESEKAFPPAGFDNPAHMDMMS